MNKIKIEANSEVEAKQIAEDLKSLYETKEENLLRITSKAFYLNVDIIKRKI